MKLPSSLRGERVDRAISLLLRELGRTVSVREVRMALRDGLIRIDGRRVAPGARAQGGEAVDLLQFIPRVESIVVPDVSMANQVSVLFEDERLLAVQKPSGIPTAPLRSHEPRTLLAAVGHLRPSVLNAGPPLEGGLLHRLDRDTSGVVLFAKDSKTREEMRELFRSHQVIKHYLALASGNWPDDEKVATGSIVSSADRRRVQVRPEPQNSRTEFVVLARSADGLMWVEAKTRTGRRHQIRAHLAFLGAPIVSDALYGGPHQEQLPRVALHASKVLLPDGRCFEAPLPEDLRRSVVALFPQWGDG